MSDIKLNTDTLRDYGRQLFAVEGRITEINLKMKSLYTSVPITDLGKLIRADQLANFSVSLLGCANYCYGTANEFDELENKLCNQNPLDFNKPPVAGVAEFLYDASCTVGAAVQAGIDVVDHVVDAASDVIKYVEEHGMEILDIVCDVVTVAIAAVVIAGLIVGTGGLGVGAVVAIIAGAYALADLGDKAFGFNGLEVLSVAAGAGVGFLFGNAAAGAAYGKAAFSASSVAVDIASIAKNPGKIITSGQHLTKAAKAVGKGYTTVKNISNKIKPLTTAWGDVKGTVKDSLGAYQDSRTAINTENDKNFDLGNYVGGLRKSTVFENIGNMVQEAKGASCNYRYCGFQLAR